jgi:uncharacterized cupin superfamily protein
MDTKPTRALDIPVTGPKSVYPEPFARLVEGRRRMRLGNHFGLTQFGVNLTELAPGAISALYHAHEREDEFIYVVAGTPTLVAGGQDHLLQPGECCGFKAGNGVAHQLVNRTQAPVLFIEVGHRSAEERVDYPNDDLLYRKTAEGWAMTHKDGRPY